MAGPHIANLPIISCQHMGWDPEEAGSVMKVLGIIKG